MGGQRQASLDRQLICLFSVSKISNQHELSLAEMLGRMARELPVALQHPDIACGGIRLADTLYTVADFLKTPWMICQDITVFGQPAGVLEVGYVADPGAESGDPFLDEERRLIGMVAELVGRIVERRRTEAAFEESENRFQSLVEGALTGISIVQDDEVVYQNPEQERLLGPLPRFNKLLDRESIHPDDRDKVEAYYRRARAGSTVPADLDFRFYPRVSDPSDAGIKWIHCRIVTTRYRGRRALLVNIMDITPTKEMEHMLRVRDKMSSLGRVAAGIAHEIRNPLSGINIYLNTLEKIQSKGPPAEKAAKILTQLRSASMKIESVIKRVMDFSKPNTPHLVRCDPNRAVTEAVSLSHVMLRKSGIQLDVRPGADLPECLIDATLIEEVVLNLVTNAAEALKTVDRDKQIRIGSARQSDSVRITVADSGPGIPTALRTKIFDPFYTTRNGSTGIGLSISKRIITDHGGRLHVEPSARLGGAAFMIDLPIPAEGNANG